MQKLKIYYTSDIHGYLFPTDYVDHKEKEMGLLQVIHNFHKDGNTLVIDGGDIFQGSPYINYYQKRQVTHNGIAEVMNAGGYDYITLGNHDFNYGFDFLKENLDRLDATVTAVNVLDKASGEPIFPKQIKVLENGLKVGIIGLVTDYINVWEKPENIEDIEIVSPFIAAQEAIEELKEEQVDFLVGIYHGGFEADLDTGELLSTTTENIGYRLAKELSFDLLLTGHQHATIEGQYVEGTYVVQPTNMGRNFFEIEVAVSSNHDIEIESTLYESGIQYDEVLSNSLSHLEKKVQNYLDTPIGKIATAVLPQSHLTLAQVGNPIVEWIAYVQKLETNADISIVGMTNHRQKLPQEISVRDILANYPFDNTLVKLKINGKILKAVLERTAEYFTLIDGAVAVNPSWLVPKVEHYNYDFYLGIQYTFDISKAVGERVTTLLCKGKPVRETDEFTVALNNYRAFGGGEYTAYSEAEVLEDTQKDIQQLLIDYIQQHGTIEVPAKLDFHVINSEKL